MSAARDRDLEIPNFRNATPGVRPDDPVVRYRILRTEVDVLPESGECEGTRRGFVYDADGTYVEVSIPVDAIDALEESCNATRSVLPAHRSAAWTEFTNTAVVSPE